MIREILNENPLVYTLDNVLSPKECLHFISISNDKLKQALVSGDKEGFVSTGRTGSNYWLPHQTDTITSQVHQRIADLVGRPKENAESYQIIYYGENQKYEYHLDAFSMNPKSEKSKRCLKMGGQRLLTALVYLNNTEEGGETEFKNLNLKVYPKVGKMVVFENCYPETNIPHPNSLHSGRPVIKGEKYAFNLWFREYPLTYHYDLEKEIIKQNTFINKNTKAIEKEENKAIEKEENKAIEKEENKAIEKEENKDTQPYFQILENLITEEDNLRLINKIKENKISKITNYRESFWIKDEILEKKIEDKINLPKSFFEGFNVVKYTNKSGHGMHFDAYDIESESGIECCKKRGNRKYTLIIPLSIGNSQINFRNCQKKFDCQKNQIILYGNLKNNSSQRNELLQYEIINHQEESIFIFLYLREKNNQGEFLTSELVLLEREIINQEFSNYLIDLKNFYEKVSSGKIENNNTLTFKSSKIDVEASLLRLLSDNYLNNQTLINSKIFNQDYFFDEYHPIVIEDIFNSDIFQIIQAYYHHGINERKFILGDRQSQRYKAYDEIISRILQYELLPLIEKITKEKLKPTYTYLSAYIKDADLPPHTDRPDCEYTVSFLIDKPVGTEFPIYVDLTKQPVKHRGRYENKPDKSKCVMVDCSPNGLMMFNGTDHIHFREKLNTDYFITLLLHYRKDN